LTGHQVLLFLHLFAVALASGVGFINLWCLRVAKGQSADILKGIAFQQKSLRNFGYALVLTILVTGIWQMINMGGMVGLHVWFDAKLVFAAIWLIAYIAMRMSVSQMTEPGKKSLAARVNVLAHISWVSAAIAMFCAVMAFAN
jgi:hypothetical protein